jgi:hypothetical protein
MLNVTMRMLGVIMLGLLLSIYCIGCHIAEYHCAGRHYAEFRYDDL